MTADTDTTSSDTTDQFSLVHVPEESTFEIRDGDNAAGTAHYVQGESSRTFDHTVVLPEYGGQGLAAKLVRFALDNTVADGQRITPVCSYVQAFVRKNHEYDEHVDWPEGVAAE
ncbi:MAG TPA: GNAT family N-acetyltransferase [Terrimesophilobacter sp.]|nr:GNAT family N-acetyltransferase [Terrimesophilobacter sp.]HRP99874.1 GNAT family N-acetyltransferase [Terrimesophilobacter sp.]